MEKYLPKTIEYYYLECIWQVTETWYSCRIVTKLAMEGEPKPKLSLTLECGKIVKEITYDDVIAYNNLTDNNKKDLLFNGTDIKTMEKRTDGVCLTLYQQISDKLFSCGVLDSSLALVADNPSKLGDKIYVTREQLTKYYHACTNNGYIEYNSETKEITPINNPLCFATLLEQLNKTKFYIKVSDVGQFDGSVTPSKIGDGFWISYEDFNKYEAIGEGKAIIYDIETKAISIIEVEPTYIPLSEQAKPLYDNTLASYGSGYLWNKLDKVQQAQLTEYLDALDAIAHDEEHNATELPTKPDFIK